MSVNKCRVIIRRVIKCHQTHPGCHPGRHLGFFIPIYLFIYLFFCHKHNQANEIKVESSIVYI